MFRHRKRQDLVGYAAARPGIRGALSHEQIAIIILDSRTLATIGGEKRRQKAC
ncbi:hypothetical protein HMPREF0201_01578 [Cedecea davisae DSM 4568]|uniref:Uncharacterized protein n=1 Tax=Cedecea davisae DSM 4568 TaxID=566551 RepID=S3JDD0_9ENTR|nr:hypothetical protein HMPREF0201_01578 [Cedecea davisae DSM 4568]